MASITRQVAIAVDTQTAEGTANTTIAGLTGALTLANGIVKGDSESGLIGSGLTYSFNRRERPPGELEGSFTRLDGDFLEQEITFSFAFPLCGPRKNTETPAVGGNFKHEKGIDALLKCCGLSGSLVATSWQYVPIDALFATMKIFDSGEHWVVRDIRGNLNIRETPAEIPIVTCTLVGIIDSVGQTTFPSPLDYEEQASVNAIACKEANPIWGQGATVRGWSELEIAIENNLEKILDSASDVGFVYEQAGRTITVSMTMKDDDGDPDFTQTNMTGTAAPTDDLDFTVGSAAGDASPALAHQIQVANLRVQSYTPAVAGKKAASQVTAVATGLTDGSEFFLTFF